MKDFPLSIQNYLNLNKDDHFKTGDYTSPLTKIMQTLSETIGDTERGNENKEKNPPLKFIEHSFTKHLLSPM